MPLTTSTSTTALLQAYAQVRRLDDRIVFGGLRSFSNTAVNIDVSISNVQLDLLSRTDLIGPVQLAGYVARRENTTFKAEPPPKSSSRPSKSNRHSKKDRDGRRKGGRGGDDDDESDCETPEAKVETGKNVAKEIFTPTRLIDLEGVSPRLRVLQDDEPDLRYATLSYCWRENEQRLMRDNVQDYCREIPVANLSKVCRDGMDIAKRNGFRYLWIDSLCIVEDSEDDWLQESVKIYEVFRNGAITISETHVPDSQSGLCR